MPLASQDRTSCPQEIVDRPPAVRSTSPPPAPRPPPLPPPPSSAHELEQHRPTVRAGCQRNDAKVRGKQIVWLSAPLSETRARRSVYWRPIELRPNAHKPPTPPPPHYPHLDNKHVGHRKQLSLTPVRILRTCSKSMDRRKRVRTRSPGARALSTLVASNLTGRDQWELLSPRVRMRDVRSLLQPCSRQWKANARKVIKFSATDPGEAGEREKRFCVCGLGRVLLPRFLCWF